MKYLFGLLICCSYFALCAEETMHIKNVIDEFEIIEIVKEQNLLDKCLDIFQEIYNKQETTIFSTKIDGSIVSNLELQIEQAIGAFLHKNAPWAAFTGEEGVHYDALVGDSSYTWFLDPIDGTISFCNGLDTFAFTLTLSHNSQAIATVIYFPRLQKTYRAFKGCGATLNGKTINMNAAQISPKPVFAVSDNYTFEMTKRKDVLKNLRKLPYITRTITDIFGYCMVAEGKCIGKFDAAGALWDLLPGYLLIKEAGGKCLYFPMREPTDDLAGSMLIGREEVVDEVYSFLNAKIDRKTLPLPVEIL